MEGFFAWLSNDPIATTIVIAAFGVVVIAITFMYVMAFLQGRSVSFWPPKIGEKPASSVQTYNPNFASSNARSYFQDPLLISSAKKNRLKIDSEFLHWEQCTILMWVLVPPKGQGLRNSPSNRYLLAHHTGEADRESYTYFNQFCLRHSSSRERWDITFSNNKAEYTSSPLLIADGLEPGWHHFLVAWDRTKPKRIFLIDEGKGGSDISTSFSCWPERLAEKVSVGAWMSDWEGHYCETKLFRLVIVDIYLETTDLAVKKHLGVKPRT